ncbi:MAG: polyprenol monophosphomannose synthase [Elusimicrobiota bacterium]|jgi:dolichol-phosphate mannosyltransferase|nr:polyprenol monophosphomannose synthase [Elusimicrobiota bacterium]
MKIVVVIPTYNEAGSIGKVINDVCLNCPDAEILVVDDNSPDETYKSVEIFVKANPKIHLLLRKENRGRGYAGIDGFKKALSMDADFIVEMDGDGSHNPKYIANFLELANSSKCDAIIGSRYIDGGKDEERGFLRHFVSKSARFYLSFVLGVNIKDPTSGFRMFKRKVLEAFVDELRSNDPFIVTEILYYLKKNNCVIKEYPIEFLSRFAGKSKLKIQTLIKYLFKVLKLKLSEKK